jgi:LuxR family transcriptional regulator, maltose regulon positive regulatory protein
MPNAIRTQRSARATPRRRRLPDLRAGTLRRDRLLQRLAQTADVPITVLVAPAGYGKTTLLVHWLGHDPRRVAWVSIDESDNDADRLGASIALAIEGTVAPCLAPAHGAGAIADELTSALSGAEHPFVLVLDDVHRLHSRRAVTMLRAVADAVPRGSQLVLASRREPPLPIGGLRAAGRLVDLRQSDLAMTRREAAAVLSLTGLDLQPQDVLVLLRRTEGWPAGIYLAALSLHGKEDLRGAVARFGGDDRLMADYVRDELLDALEDDQRAFLRRTSVLDRLSGPLCDALLGHQGSGEVLRHMSRSNLLLVPLDSADNTYRYHAALARTLQAELGRVEPQFEAELHRRASRWFADAGDIDRAIGHAIDGGDAERVGSLLWISAAARVLDGRTAEVRRWLERLSPEQIAQHPTLALSAATTHLADGDRGRVAHWTAIAAARRGDRREPSIDAGIALMRAVVADDGVGSMACDAAQAFEHLPHDSPWRALCGFLQGVAAHLGDTRNDAESLLEEAARRGAVAARGVQVLCLAQLALIAVDADDWDRAPLLAARAREQAERMAIADDPTSALVYATSALVRAHRGRVDDAQADRRRAMELLTRLDDYAPWYAIETRIVLARAALRLGDVTGTRTLLGEVSRLLSRSADAVVLRRWTDELWAQVEAFATTALVGPSSLTTAELRVLVLLPTHLSFREIGRHLHVSANTVKTHAHAVYRKLDVCSRSEAVVRARETALLDPDA